MNIVNTIKGAFMSVFSFFRGQVNERLTGITTDLSTQMLDYIELWNAIVAGEAPWNKKAPPCGVPSQIANRLATLVSREISLETSNEALAEVVAKLDQDMARVTEHMALCGGSVLRPVFAEGKLQYELLPLGRYLPTKYAFDGTLQGAVLLKEIAIQKARWLLAEVHQFDGANHSVEEKLYRYENGALKVVPLTDCPMTKDTTPQWVWQGVKFPMLVEFRNRAENHIDGSMCPVPIIAGCEKLIKAADEQYSRILWEQEGGELKVFADKDLLTRPKRSKDGILEATEQTPYLNRLMVMLEGDGTGDTGKIKEFAPALRTTQQNEALQVILKRLELACGLGKGTLSDTEEVKQTATQYAGGRNDLYALVDKIEDEIKLKIEDSMRVFAYMAAAYGVGSNNPAIEVKWNDEQTRKDMQQAKQMALQEIANGIMDKAEYRQQFYGEDEATAKANVPQGESVQSDWFMGGA